MLHVKTQVWHWCICIALPWARYYWMTYHWVLRVGTLRIPEICGVDPLGCCWSTPRAGWRIIWLVVSNMNFIFHDLWDVIPTPLTNSYFSRWLLHHQADYDSNAPKDPGTPLKFCEKPYGFSRRFQDFGKRGTTHFGRSRQWMWHRTPVWRSGGVLEQHQQSGFQAKSSDRWIQFRFQVRGQWSDVDNWKIIWLVVWNMFLFFHILGMSSSQLTNSIIFQRGRSTTNQ